MSEYSTGIILHYTENEHNHIRETLQSILNQTNQSFEFFLINEQDKNHKKDEQIQSDLLDSIGMINVEEGTLGNHLNKALSRINSQYVLYIDNRQNQIQLKQAALDLMLLHMKLHPDSAMVYSDYDLIDDHQINERKLLKHHKGRLRDNQDYGWVYLFRKNILDQLNGFNESLIYNTLYDIRLRLAVNHNLTHISNKYCGAVYTVNAPTRNQNVFDYLLAGKESQLEAENVLNRHLKDIGAYLKPGDHYQTRPQSSENLPLDATIIIPVNNRPDFIGTAIKSVLDQINQNIEVIVVVNGGEKDPTVQEVGRYMPNGDLYKADKPQVRILVYDINNIGFCLNMGAIHAKGKYYVQLDSDDRLKPDAVQKILAVYKDDPKIGMVIGSYEVWEKQADTSLARVEEIPVVTHDEWTEENGRNNLLRINGAGAPRSIPISILREMGFGMNEEPFTRNYGEDYDMVLRISEKHRIGRVWEPIYEVVRHSGGTDHSIDQLTIDQNDEAKDLMRYQAVKRRQKLNRKL